jgi:DNA ligase (NAD+)
VGETVAKKLAKEFKNIDALKNANQQELENVDEIGERIAESVVEFFADEENLKNVERLKGYGLQLEISAEKLAGQTNKLEGETFVVSGVFEMSRNDLKKLIEDNGGKVSGSISSKTSYVVAGENMGPSKLAKAESLQIPIIDEKKFLKMIE